MYQLVTPRSWPSSSHSISPLFSAAVVVEADQDQESRFDLLALVGYFGVQQPDLVEPPLFGRSLEEVGADEGAGVDVYRCNGLFALSFLAAV